VNRRQSNKIPPGSGNRYRYEYEEGKTQYKGPVGEAPELSEEEFLERFKTPTIIDIDDHTPELVTEPAGEHEKTYHEVAELQKQLEGLTGKSIDGVVFKGREGKFIQADDPTTTRLKPDTWKNQFIDEFVKVNYGYGSRAKRYKTALKKIVVQNKDVPNWKEKVEDDLVGPGAVRDGSKKHNLIIHLEKEGSVAQTELKKAGMLPGGRQGGMILGGWADDGYIIKSKRGKSVYYDIGPLGKKVLKRTE